MPILRSKYSDDLEINETVSLTDFVLQGTKQYGNKTAFIDDASGDQITYSELEKKINTLASALYQRGTRKGDLVCLFADKSILGTIAVFAILKLGAIMTPCRPSHTSRELATQLNDSGSTVIIADQKLIETTKAASENAPGVQTVYTIGHVDGYESLDDMIKDSNVEMPDCKINPKEDTAMIMYSSGTTGLPKGVMLTHYNLVSLTTVSSHTSLNMTVDDVTLHTAPPFHVGGILRMMAQLYAGKTLVLYTPLSLVDYLLKAKHHKATFIRMLPNQLTELCNMSTEKIKGLEMDFSEITITTGGSTVSATVTREVLRKCGAKAIVQLYGSTEGGLIAIDYLHNFVAGSAGKVCPSVQIKVVDLKSGKDLGPHEEGEILIKAPFVTRGYLNNPEATKESIDNDGWFHTGDIGYYDESEHLFICGRLKDVIKYKTMQISPAEIEEVIYTHPAVKSVCVVGIDDDDAGEVPLACVIVKDGHSVTEQEIVGLVEENVADYKRLRGGVRFMKEFPLASLGKIVRRELADRVRAELTTK